jgi:serine/threonine protein kinase
LLEKTYLISELADLDLMQFMADKADKNVAGVNDYWIQKQLKGLSEALMTIHEQANGFTAYHHDIKPQNVLVFVDDNNRLKLTDWGCAALSSVPQQGGSEVTGVMGNPPYVPPEYVDCNPTSRPHDIWSLGCVFMELLVWYLEGRVAYQHFCKGVFDEDTSQRKCYFVPTGDSYILVTTVERKMESLATRGNMWTGLIDTIREMLKVDPEGCFSAAQVVANLP